MRVPEHRAGIGRQFPSFPHILARFLFAHDASARQRERKPRSQQFPATAITRGAGRRSAQLDGSLSVAEAPSRLYDMRHAITIRLDPELEKLLTRVRVQTGRSRSDLVCKALRRQLSRPGFEALRRQALPFAEARGYLPDEDVARDIS